MTDEPIILAGTPVRFPVAPAQERDGEVFAQFENEGRRFFILKYRSADEPAFATLQRGQFTILKDRTNEPRI